MKHNLFSRPMVVMSVTNDDNHEDWQAQLDARDILVHRLNSRGFVTEPVIGCWQGVKELSVMALLPNDLGHLVRCVELATDDYAQECILFIDPEGKGYQVSKCCCINYIGQCHVIQKNDWLADQRPDNRTELADGRFFHFVK